MYKNTFQNVKSSRKKPACTSSDAIFAHIISVKREIFMACIKKMKKCPVNSCNQALKIAFFYTSHKKCPFFHWNLVHTHIMSEFTRMVHIHLWDNVYLDVIVKMYIIIFWTMKMTAILTCWWGIVSSATWCMPLL